VERRRVIIDPDGTLPSYVGVIVQHPTGVLYEQHCAGIETDLRAVEGYFVLLGGCRYGPDQGMTGFEELRAPFHKMRGCLFGDRPYGRPGQALPPDRLAKLKLAVESITCWDSRDRARGEEHTHLLLDESRVGELVEAWVPVITPDGPGILIWPNCC